MATPPPSNSVEQVGCSFCSKGRAAAAAAAAADAKKKNTAGAAAAAVPVDKVECSSCAKSRLRKIELQVEAARVAAAARGEKSPALTVKMSQCAVCKKSKKRTDMIHYVGTAPRVDSVRAEIVSMCDTACLARVHEVV